MHMASFNARQAGRSRPKHAVSTAQGVRSGEAGGNEAVGVPQDFRSGEAGGHLFWLDVACSFITTNKKRNA